MSSEEINELHEVSKLKTPFDDKIRTEVMEFEKLATQRFELAKLPELWQFDLLNPQQLCQFATRLNIHINNADTITDLWRVGLLRADLLSAPKKIDIPSIELVSEENAEFVYLDKRQIGPRSEGFGGSFSKIEAVFDNDIVLLFHPFRVYVLYHVHRIFRSNFSSTQYLQNQEGLVRLAKFQIDMLNQSTSRNEFAESFEHWNRVAEFSIILEPTAYSKVFHESRWKFPDTHDSMQAKIAERLNKVRQLFVDVSIEEINEIRAGLCRNAELMDDNKLVHVLLRLMSRHERLKLRSALGGAMLFLSMAEIIRRAAEDALQQDLPEEDEIGFGRWFDGARRSLFGTERIFDAPRETRRDFMTSMGLDCGVKVRCYVEGDTEYGALTSAVGEAGGTEFVNLRGQVTEKRGKGLGFLASLKNDMKSNVFSVVLLDQDRTDNIRAMKKAASDEAIFGRFFISTPDFEFANFTVSELLDVYLDQGYQDRDLAQSRTELLEFLAKAESGKQFFDLLKQKGLHGFQKSESWGVALMKYALEYQNLPNDHKKAGEIRPLLEIAQLLVTARGAGYLRSLQKFKIDPDTGELIKK